MIPRMRAIIPEIMVRKGIMPAKKASVIAKKK